MKNHKKKLRSQYKNITHEGRLPNVLSFETFKNVLRVFLKYSYFLVSSCFTGSKRFIEKYHSSFWILTMFLTFRPTEASSTFLHIVSAYKKYLLWYRIMLFIYICLFFKIDLSCMFCLDFLRDAWRCIKLSHKQVSINPFQRSHFPTIFKADVYQLQFRANMRKL